jgi:hypothetical protein
MNELNQKSFAVDVKGKHHQAPLGRFRQPVRLEFVQQQYIVANVLLAVIFEGFLPGAPKRELLLERQPAISSIASLGPTTAVSISSSGAWSWYLMKEISSSAQAT